MIHISLIAQIRQHVACTDAIGLHWLCKHVDHPHDIYLELQELKKWRGKVKEKLVQSGIERLSIGIKEKGSELRNSYLKGAEKEKKERERPQNDRNRDSARDRKEEPTFVTLTYFQESSSNLGWSKKRINPLVAC